VAGKDKRSVHASLNGKGDLRVAWWNLYSRIYMAVVPSANGERAMYSFHRINRAITLGWLSYLVAVADRVADVNTVVSCQRPSGHLRKK